MSLFWYFTRKEFCVATQHPNLTPDYRENAFQPAGLKLCALKMELIQYVVKEHPWEWL